MKATSYFGLAGSLMFLAWSTPVQAQFDYTTNADGVSVTVTDYTGLGGAVDIPSAVNGLPVTAIGSQALAYCSLTGVTIPNSVTSIGDYAFWYSASLTSLTIPNSVTNIGDDAFANCSGLKTARIGNSVNAIASEMFAGCYSLVSVMIPSSVTNIGEGAFNSCSSLPSITIPNSVTTLGSEAFVTCLALSKITIPDSVTEIGDDAFFECDMLTTVTIPDSVTNIGVGAFESCARLTKIAVVAQNPAYSSLDGVLFDKTQTALLEFPNGNSGSYIIPDTVNVIEDSAFAHCHLASVTIPDSVVSIEPYAFSGCDQLANVMIPSGVTNFGDWAFWSCPDLTNAVIGNGTTSIGNWAFTSCSSLVSVTLPVTVTSIGDGLFNGCSSLASVAIPSSVTNIGVQAFQGCGLVTVTIPNSVIAIGSQAFDDCPELSAFHVDAGNSYYADVNGVLFNKTQTTLIQYPYSNSASVYAIPGGVTNIGDFAFEDCTNLGSVTIPNSAVNVGEYAFEGCSKLTQIMVGDGVTNIGDAAFSHCFNLTSLLFAGEAPAFGSGVFAWIVNPGGNFPSLEFDPATIYYLYGGAGWEDFSTNTPLPTIPLRGPAQFGATENGLEYIASATQVIITAYDGSNNAVMIPSNVGGVPVTGIGTRAFVDRALGSVSIPSGVTIIGDEAFDYCTNLADVIIPASVTNIGLSAFADCFSLTNIYFLGNAPHANGSVFFDPYYGSDPTTTHYLPGTLGWGGFATNNGIPITPWFLPQPLILNQVPGFGMRSNQFGFTISWATNVPVVVEACTNLANPVWEPIATNTISSGTSDFSDPQWMSYPGRFYRLRSF